MSHAFLSHSTVTKLAMKYAKSGYVGKLLGEQHAPMAKAYGLYCAVIN